MKVYPISRSKDLTRQAITALMRAGHEVVLDWTANGARLYSEKDQRIALDDEHAIRECDAIVMMWVPAMKAAFFELGMAYALNKLCIVVGADKNDMVFFRLPRIRHVATLDEALTTLALGSL